MVHFKDKKTSEIRAFNNVSEAKLFINISLFELMGDEEVDNLYNPEKYLSAEAKLLIYRQNIPTLPPIKFDIKLNNAGLYDAVQELIKDKFEMRIAYNRATFFSRTDPFIDQARIALGLTDEQVDAMWEQQ